MEINKLRDLNSHGLQLLRTKDEPVFGFILRAICIATFMPHCSMCSHYICAFCRPSACVRSAAL